MDRNPSMGADSIDWADPAFNTADFQDSMLAESPWGNSAINDFTNLADYSDSPAALGLRTPSKSGPNATTAGAAQQRVPGLPQETSFSAESSSADSGSESSSRRKRKTTSESPLSMQGVSGVSVKEEPAMSIGNYNNAGAFQQTFTQPMPSLAVDQNMMDQDAMFDFNSAASSPNLPRDFSQQMSLEAKKSLMQSGAVPHFSRSSPVQTINPGMFTLGGSRDQSPATNAAMFNAASPNAIFSTPSSDSNETYNANQIWAGNVTHNPAWPTDFASQFASPNGLSFTPSPVANGGTPAIAPRAVVQRATRSPLHIAPISAKSRVETQINVIMTLEKPPPGIEHLHLPLHTIAKSKLLAKEEYDPAKVLELHTMLVCSSAMHNSQAREKALQRAASQNNDEIQRRAEVERESADDEKNSGKGLEDSEKPANGGEVRICTNCIQRERKRAGRKKLKKEEEQQHWERYETERVVVFNSSEFLPFKPFDHRDQAHKEASASADEPYEPPSGSISASAAMRIACYCRHQSEKEGFQVIFTMKDQSGHVVAQEMSDSILITDDHKTHPHTLTSMASDGNFQPSGMNGPGLQTSYSMMDLPSHSQPFTSSRSAGNLQALAYGSQLQFNPHSHVHQLSGSGFMSQGTSATMTPMSLSRPGSPTSAGQSGPNKKRKSASFHKRMPSGLQMTPRVDTTQNQTPSAAAIASGMTMANFSPTRAGFAGQSEASYMTIPTSSGPAQFYGGSGPTTPSNENSQFGFGPPHQLDIPRLQNAAYFSHPSSAVPSRSNSPVLQHSRPVMPTYPRANAIQTPTNQLGRAPGMFGGQATSGAASVEPEQTISSTITKITPTEGPVAGGTEVSVFGYNFTHATQIMFGDNLAPTTFYGSQSILAISPPGRKGGVRIKIVANGAMQYNSTQSSNPVFTYTDTNPQMMEMALRFLSQQQTGDPSRWMQYTNEVANQFMQTSISAPSMSGQGYGGGNMFASASADVEASVLKILDMVDASESPRQPCYDMQSGTGQTMLSLASASGMHQVVAALLARGANPDVRDGSGYTPLMHAALQEGLRTFQLLLRKGADPIVRSLTGLAAIDLVPISNRDDFLRILQNTPRARSTRPSLNRSNSQASKLSWDISSASFYESETDISEPLVDVAGSRRPSIHCLASTATAGIPPPTLSSSIAAATAWRDLLAAQVHQLQQNVHTSVTTFQLPSIHPFADCQGHAMVRRLSSLVAGRTTMPLHQSSLWDMFSAPSPPSPPPPAYAELYPYQEPSTAGESIKKSAAQTAVLNAMADAKCATLFRDRPQSASCLALSNKPGEESKATTSISAVYRWACVALLVTMFSFVVLPAIPILAQRLLSGAEYKDENYRSTFNGLTGICELPHGISIGTAG